jgi:hypothetical protein
MTDTNSWNRRNSKRDKAEQEAEYRLRQIGELLAFGVIRLHQKKKKRNAGTADAPQLPYCGL